MRYKRGISRKMSEFREKKSELQDINEEKVRIVRYKTQNSEE